MADAGCKWIYGHKQSGSNITTRGDYIITQYYARICYLLLGLSDCLVKNSSYWEQGTSSTNPSKNWSWAQIGDDGAHAFAQSNMYLTIDYKGYPDPVIKASDSTYYIDYGAVDMSYENRHWQINPNCTELPCPAGTANLGTFYNHTAASAGSSLNVTRDTFFNSIVPDSICPKGWTIPTLDTNDNKSFNNMFLTAYGVREVSSGGTNADVIALYPPLSFLRSGYYDHTSTTIYNSGIQGFYWKSSVKMNTAGAAQQLILYPSSFTTTGGYYRGRGYSVRCVSRS